MNKQYAETWTYRRGQQSLAGFISDLVARGYHIDIITPTMYSQVSQAADKQVTKAVIVCHFIE